MPPPGAQGGAHGDFLLAAGRARHQKIRDIGTCDQQHQRHGAEHDENRQPHVADDRFDQRHDVDGERPIAVVLLADSGELRPVGQRATEIFSREAAGV